MPAELYAGADAPADLKASVRQQRRQAAALIAQQHSVTVSRFGTVLSAGARVQLYHGAIEHEGELEVPLLPPVDEASPGLEEAYVAAMAAARTREQVLWQGSFHDSLL